MQKRIGALVFIITFAMSASSANAIVVPVNAPTTPLFLSLDQFIATVAGEAAQVVAWAERSVATVENRLAAPSLSKGGLPYTASAAAAAQTQSSQQPLPQFITYTVESGDTRSGIAQSYGVSLASLLGTNNLSPQALLHPGETLTIPQPQATLANNPPRTPSTMRVTAAEQPIVAAAIVPSTQSSGDALSARLASLTGIVGNVLALLPSLQQPEPQSNDVSVQSQIDALSHEIAQTNQINNLSNITIENPTVQGGVSGLTAAEIPALDYLSLSGGTLGGNLQLNGNATTTGSSYFAGNLGIGTSTSDALALNGSAYLADITPPSDTENRLYSNGGSLYWAGSVISSAGTGHWTTDGTNVWRAGGSVGIGTSSPFATLSVVGNGYFTGGLTAANASTTNLSVSGNSVLGSATSTSLFSPIADFTNGVISTLNASVANIVGFTATNATTTNLAITSLPSTLLSTNANGSVQSTTISSPLALSGSTLSIAQANGSSSGFLSSSDWTNFNGKLGSSTISSLSANYDPLWNGSAFVNGALYDTGSAIGIGTTSPSYSLDVNGIVRGQFYDQGGAVYNVKAFGAKGDGSTDDTAAIQNALTAAAGTSGGIVYFPAGTYIVHGLVTPHAPLTIECAGRQVSILKLKNNANTYILATYTYVNNDNYVDEFLTIDGCGFNGNYANEAGTSSIMELHTYDATIMYSEVDDSSGYGIDLTTLTANGGATTGGVSSNRILNTYFTNNQGAAVFGSGLPADEFIYNNNFGTNGGTVNYQVEQRTPQDGKSIPTAFMVPLSATYG